MSHRTQKTVVSGTLNHLPPSFVSRVPGTIGRLDLQSRPDMGPTANAKISVRKEVVRRTVSQTQERYRELIAALKRTALMGSCASLLGWDEQTYLPPGGAEHRANQLGLLAGLTHERATSPRIGELLVELEGNPDCGEADSAEAVNVREARRSYDRATKMPRRLVEELSHTTTLAQQAWVAARKNIDFKSFLPWLDKVVTLKREEAEAVGYGDGVPYDALLDDYEPGATAKSIDAVFAPLRDALVPLVTEIAAAQKRADTSVLTRHYPVEAQKQFGIKAAKRIGFCFDDGRLDETAHPFCSGIGPGDCRLTTRYDAHHFPGAFFGVMHEAGHGIYEQGLDRDAFGTAMGETVSLGIHESQSRLWENFVGRSRAFWNFFFRRARTAFPEALNDMAVGEFYAAINDVRPSFIRVEADEVTYNLHIMLRFELERPLLDGSLKAADLPGVWNETFTRYFGITPPNDAQGCLQDIHWSAGLIGYFPTYALGNMYAAQFFAAAGAAIGELDQQLARGDFKPLREWLRNNIHRRGKQCPAHQLVEVVTGQGLSHEPLMAHLRNKFSVLYGL